MVMDENRGAGLCLKRPVRLRRPLLIEDPSLYQDRRKHYCFILWAVIVLLMFHEVCR